MTKDEIELKQCQADMDEAFKNAMLALNECNAAFKDLNNTINEFIGKAK